MDSKVENLLVGIVLTAGLITGYPYLQIALHGLSDAQYAEMVVQEVTEVLQHPERAGASSADQLLTQSKFSGRAPYRVTYNGVALYATVSKVAVGRYAVTPRVVHPRAP